LAKEKTGVELKGIKAINPVNNEKIPIWVADYVLAGYGTGAIMAVPAHDERDWEFARKYKLPIRQVVSHNSINYNKTLKALKLLDKINKKVKEKNIKVWLLGGLACAFYAGVIYREHEDLDLIVKTKNDLEIMKEILKELDFENDTKKKTSNLVSTFTYKNSEGMEIDINCWNKDLKGEIVAFEDDFEKNEKELLNCKSLVLSYKYIKKFKKYQCEKRGKEKDLLDLKFLNNKTKTPEQSPEDFDEPEDSHPRYEIQSCHSNNSIRNNKNLVKKEAYVENGVNINSDFLNGMETEEAKKEIIKWLEENNFGKKSINYKMRDWVFSRQRYWGEPIPIVHCEKCGAVAVPENQLPIKLPEVKNYEPTGTGESPLANINEWVNTTCPKCGGPAKRETNTMPQWAGSCWYYLRYLDSQNDKELAGKEKEEYWMKPNGVDLYVGGAEHATRHLLYARFWHKFLYDIKAVSTLEPFHKLFYVGLILAADGRKMSKRWGNVINPDDIVEKYGADSLRLYEMFMGPFSQATAWNTNGLIGMRRFLEKTYGLQDRITNHESRIINKEVERLLHKTIKKVAEDIENFKFNTAVSQLMILVNEMDKCEKLAIANYQLLITILSPFAPHIAEDLWEKLENKESIFKQKWPAYNPELIKEEEIELVVQVNGKLRDRIKASADITEDEARKLVLESELVKKWMAGKEIKKFIFIKGKLVNIVV